MSRDALERRTAARKRRSGTPRKTLVAEIEELERRIESMSYMDDDGEMDEVMEEVSMSGPAYMDEEMEEVGMDDLGLEDDMAEPVMVEETTVMDDAGDIVEPVDEMEDYCGEIGMRAAEPDIEDKITQEYLSELQDEMGAEGLTTGDSMLDIAPTRFTGSEEYVTRLQRASARLDRVASYCEKHGRVKLAKKIDEIADAIDARIAETRRAQ